MLKSLRKKGVAKKIIWATAIVIIVSFGFFGTAYLLTGEKPASDAGEIFGKNVSVDDFGKSYRATRIQAIRQYGENLAKVSHLLNLESQTWDRLILLHEAKRRKVKISNQQIIQAIAQDQSFRRNNRFDMLLYDAILRNLQIRPREYEESVRDHLIITELYRQATSSVTVSEEEVFGEYKTRNEKVQVSYVFVKPELPTERTTIDQELLKRYYADHKQDFLLPPAVNVQYVTFDFPQTEELPDSEQAQSEQPPKEALEAKLSVEKDIARKKAQTLFQELLVNPDMKEAARLHQYTVQVSGFFNMEQPNLSLGWSYDLLNKIFQMDQGEVNEPFETADGLSVIQIKEKRESYVPEFEEAKSKIYEAIDAQEADLIARNKAGEYLGAIINELDKSKLKDFQKAAKTLGLEIHQTPVFSRGQYLPQIGISKDFQEAAFRLTENVKISPVVSTGSGYAILYLDNYVPASSEQYEKIKDEMARTIFSEKQEAAFGDFMAQLRTKASLIDHISKSHGRP